MRFLIDLRNPDKKIDSVTQPTREYADSSSVAGCALGGIQRFVMIVEDNSKSKFKSA